MKAENEELSKKLHELQIDAGNTGSDTAASEGQMAFMSDQDIIDMNNDLANTNRDMAKLQERFRRIKIVNDQICSWSKRVYNKFRALTEDPAFQEEPNDLV